MKIIFVGDDAASPTSPLKTWASGFERQKVECTFPDPYAISIREWVAIIKSANALIYQGYGVTDPFMFRQLAIASAMGCPIVRKWSGSDIYYALKSKKIERSVLQLNKIISHNFTSEHIGICQELGSLGIDCKLLPQIIDAVNFPHLNRTSISKGVLVYLPHKRYEFYGLQYIERLVEDFQDVTFYIVADELHRLAHFKNVRSLGWVSEMEPVWELVGLVVRITEHDGYPRTVLEALARGKYVVHNRAFDGCWFASNYEDIRQCIVDFKQIKSINDKGLETAKQLLSGKSDLELIQAIKSVCLSKKKRLLAILFTFKFLVYIKMKN
jgi:hypothetical protein